MESQTTLGEKLYAIGEVTERVGLTPAALRMWERRYGAVVPARSERGRRLYTAEEVERLGLLRRATQAGFTIGAIAHLSDKALAALPALGMAAADAATPDRGDAAVARELLGRALAACKALDASGVRAALRDGAARLPLLTFAHALLAPLLAEMGGKFHSRLVKSAQEHVTYEAVHHVLVTLLGPAVTGAAARGARRGDALGAAGPAAGAADRSLAVGDSPADTPNAGAPLLIAATLDGSEHEFGAMLAALAAGPAGWRVRYLGASQPAERIADAARATGASAVVLSILYPEADRALRAELMRLGTLLGDSVRLFVGGSAAPSYSGALERIGARYLGQIDDLGPALSLVAPTR